jgi:hypothetical protein
MESVASGGGASGIGGVNGTGTINRVRILFIQNILVLNFIYSFQL